MSDRVLRLGHLYPSLMNVYGDRGNVICLQRRCALRGISLEITEIEAGEPLSAERFDLLFMGGAQDRDQVIVSRDLAGAKGEQLRKTVEEDIVFLGVCGGYQLAGRFYQGADGHLIAGAGVLDSYTVHPGEGSRRLVGNLLAEWEGGTLVGFENHGGRTFLGPKAEPLARVVRGHGNDGVSGLEGARYRNAYGCYLHGPLLPKNPALADRLLSLALLRRYGSADLQPLDDSIEWRANEVARSRP